MGIFSRFSNYNTKDGKGVKKKKITDKERYSLAGFFKTYKEKFWQLLTLNIMNLMFIFPLFFALMAFMGVVNTQSQTLTNTAYPLLYGSHLYSPNTGTAALMGIYGTQTALYTPNNITLAFYLISLITLFTFGISTTGITYVLRGYTRGDAVFIWHDFFHAIKKNFVASIIIGFLDIVLMFMLIFSVFFYYYNIVQSWDIILFCAISAMAVIYFIMRFYIYLLMITFKLSPIKLIKNALILSLIGIKRNIMAIIGMIVMFSLNVVIFMFMPNLGILLPFFFLTSNLAFIACFAAYPNIKKYMIDPYYEDHPDEQEPEKFDEPIFLDYT